MEANLLYLATMLPTFPTVLAVWVFSLNSYALSSSHDYHLNTHSPQDPVPLFQKGIRLATGNAQINHNTTLIAGSAWTEGHISKEGVSAPMIAHYIYNATTQFHLEVTDYLCEGDIYKVSINNVVLGETSKPVYDHPPTAKTCDYDQNVEHNFDAAYASPRYSHGSWLITQPGLHVISITYTTACMPASRFGIRIRVQNTCQNGNIAYSKFGIITTPTLYGSREQRNAACQAKFGPTYRLAALTNANWVDAINFLLACKGPYAMAFIGSWNTDPYSQYPCGIILVAPKIFARPNQVGSIIQNECCNIPQATLCYTP